MKKVYVFVVSVLFFSVFFSAAGLAVLRIEPVTGSGDDQGFPVVYTADNMVGGWGANYASAGVAGATISGGGGWHQSGWTGSGDMINSVTSHFGTVCGGARNEAGLADPSNHDLGKYASILGGYYNMAEGAYSVIGGGSNNNAKGAYAVVTGGGGVDPGGNWMANNATGDWSFVSGGAHNLADGDFSVVGGGGGYYYTGSYYMPVGNRAAGKWSVVGGGTKNVALGDGATVPGGNGNTASGVNSFAAGTQAKATHNGSFVWSDGAYADFNSDIQDQFLVRSSGGIYFYTNNGKTHGTFYTAASNGWENVSDRNLKENFASIDSLDILAKLVEMPVQTWTWKNEKETVRHLGPVAQDFFSAFNLGVDNRHISTMDANGIALAAIQGLNRKLEEKLREKTAEIQVLKLALIEITTRLAALEGLGKPIAWQ